MSDIKDYKVGMTVYGKITGIQPYGAFVRFDGGVTGLIHISEISNGFVRNIGRFMNIDDYVLCKIIDVDDEHKQLRLSFKALEENLRRHAKRVKYVGVPENIKGFTTLKDKMPMWMKGEYDD